MCVSEHAFAPLTSARTGTVRAVSIVSASPDTAALRKDRGAFFTPPAIAEFLTNFAIRDGSARVLDPTCGEAVFLLAAARRLEQRGATKEAIGRQLSGVDLHGPSLAEAAGLLAVDGWAADLVESDFFAVPTPAQLGDRLGWQDAVVGNPPFVRFQDHRGVSRELSVAAAAAQGVRLSGLASSWAAALVHAAAFLKPSGRLAMVLPAELLTVKYAEPVRRWLRSRFASVNLVMFEQLQFEDAEAQVVLLLAHGRGPSESFSLTHVQTADDLADLAFGDGVGAKPAEHGKWSDLALPTDVRQLFRSVTTEQMVPLKSFGAPELGIVTGANEFFAFNEETRLRFKIPERHLRRISPPGTKHLTETVFLAADWTEAKRRNERVWLFSPEPGTRSQAVREYIAWGEQRGFHESYKCRIRDPWWRPPTGTTPDLFFTYMSHRYPRLITNDAHAQFLNSMHGICLAEDVPPETRDALPLLAMNSATMLGGEIMGRSYGGGILKMEPSEAGLLPMPSSENLSEAWRRLSPQQADLEAQLAQGDWRPVVSAVDRVLLRETMKLGADEITALHDWATVYRVRRTRQTDDHVPAEGQTRRASRTRSATRRSGSRNKPVGIRCP